MGKFKDLAKRLGTCYNSLQNVIDVLQEGFKDIPDASDVVEDALDGFVRIETLNLPEDFEVPAGGYNFINYTPISGYKLIEINTGHNSLSLFTQASEYGAAPKISFFNAYTKSFTPTEPIYLIYIKYSA